MDNDVAHEIITIAAHRWDIPALIDLIADLEAAEPFRASIVDTELRELLRGSIEANLVLAKKFFGGMEKLDDGQLDRLRHYASALAMLRVPQDELMGSYRASLPAVWEHWSTAIVEVLDETNQPPSVQRSALVLGFQRMLELNGQVLSAVESSYQEQAEQLKRSGARVRLDTVRHILNDPEDALGEDLYPVLQYDLDAHHLAVTVLNVSESAAQRLSTVLRNATGAIHALTIRDSLSECVIWLARPSPWKRSIIDAVMSALKEWGGRAAVSDPACGVSGFRTAYDQLQQIAMVRRRWLQSPRVVTFSDVHLEALMLSSAADLRDFVRSELGSLADASLSAERMRDTLLAFYETGSYVGAAQVLHLHEHTVRNRIAKLESMLGHSVVERRLEVHLALRVHRVKDGPARRRVLRDE